MAHRSEQAAGILLIRITMFALLIAGMSRTWADPDLWGHVRFGQDIVSGGLPRTDPYSFTSDIPWINHEWLAEVIIYLGWAAGGGTGLVALKSALAVAALMIVAMTIRVDAIRPVAQDLLLFTAIIGIWARTYVFRPQLFSLVLYAVLLWTLRSVERGHWWRLWILPIVFALWVNLHGGWIVGLGMLGLWTAVSLTPLGTPPIRKHRLLIAMVLSCVATLINPYGVRMWTFLTETVRLDRPNISDWRPLFQSGPEVIVPWMVTAALAAIAIARRHPPIPFAHLLIILALAAASIRVNRLDAFLTLSVVMLLAPQIGLSRRKTAADVRPSWTWKPLALALVLIVIGGAAVFHLRAKWTCVRLDGPWMPEREAGALIVENHLGGRLLAWFGWGQYAIWHFAPHLKVSFDGRRETVYSDEFVTRHVRLYFEPDAEIEFLQRLGADYAWLPATLPLVGALERAGWTPLFSGPVSVVLAARSASHLAPGALTPRACFPGP